jgi:hypothetical protein
MKDFSRLDARFKLPLQTWEQIPIYQDYGFAVFQSRSNAVRTEVHPMAFEFATRLPKSLFLPTVHIHDGQVHRTERFDHTLYVEDYRLRPTQTRDLFGNRVNVSAKDGLQASSGVLKQFVDVGRADGTIEPNEIAFKRRLNGIFPNVDTIIPRGS